MGLQIPTYPLYSSDPSPFWGLRGVDVSGQGLGLRGWKRREKDYVGVYRVEGFGFLGFRVEGLRFLGFLAS